MFNIKAHPKHSETFYLKYTRQILDSYVKTMAIGNKANLPQDWNFVGAKRCMPGEMVFKLAWL